MALTPEEQRALQRSMDAAIAQVQSGIKGLDQAARERLLVLFQGAAEDVAKVLRANAGKDGFIAQHDLPAVVGQIDLILQRLRDDQIEILGEVIPSAADNGAQIITALRNAERVPDSAKQQLPDEKDAANKAAQDVLHRAAKDGLNLSDRIWRNWEGMRAALITAIQSAVLQGISANQAAREFLRTQGVAADDLITKIELARAGALGEKAREILASPEAEAYANALRVFRTEMNKASILAAREGIFATPGAVGTRAILSPRHPRFDICDMWVSVNLYGLGPGVYPNGASPIPAHPNTLTTEEAVFDWEVTPEDVAGKHDLLSWLHAQDDERLNGILQSEEKVRALRAGLITENEITLPWRELEPKYASQLPQLQR